VASRSIPVSCTLFMTDKCNFKCLFCRRAVVGVKASKEMTLDTVQKLLSLYPSIRSFSIAGLGEPTLCSDFVDIVNFLKKKGRHVGVITNGSNLGPILSLTYQPDYTSVSLYGYDNQSYLAYAGVAAYNKVVEGFLKLKKSLRNVGFSYILSRTNFRDLDNILSLCDDLRPDFLHLVNYLAYDPSNPEDVAKLVTVKDTDIIKYVNNRCRHRGYAIVRPTYVDFDKPSFCCNSYDYKLNLDGEGNVGGCLRQIPPSDLFGNIFKDNDAYNSNEMQRLRRMVHKKLHPHKECRLCFGNWVRTRKYRELMRWILMNWLNRRIPLSA